MDEDLLLALRLHEEWNLQVPEPLSLVDAQWELVDPTPDVQALFLQLNDRFFWGQLEAVEVKWSSRMTMCAGLCCYEGRGGMCSIRLSTPLLKLRPRKDLVETLLHEMIHAYLFVTNNDKDREGHGPEFCKHMHRINCLTGANITVYHSFHNEVNEYRRHWWRCDGPCQSKKPYYGYVKRATNRAPSAHDYWWAEHQKTCGGTFIKVKEPENYSKKSKGKTTPRKQPAAAAATAAAAVAKNKDKPNRGETQLVTPFSGKGYVLGEANNSSGNLMTSHAASKTQDLLSEDRSAGRANSKTQVKFEQNGSSKKTSVVSPALNTSHQTVLSNYFPRVSGLNQKASRSMNGSSKKSLPMGDISKKPISSSSQRASCSQVSLRKSFKAMESTSGTASLGASAPEYESPSKRCRLEDKTVFDDFFIKNEQVQIGGNDPKCSSHPATAAQNSSSSSLQSQMVVSCPICQSDMLEFQINEHLDWCLERDSINIGENL